MLAGKNIVVIGGTSGLGLSAVRAFVKHGACVVAVGRDRDKAEAVQAEFQASVQTLAGDAARHETAERAVAMCCEHWGRLDGLYHVAGGSGRKMGDGPLHEITEEGWEYTLDLNLTSVFLSNRAVIRRFLQQGGGGTILNMGSVLGWSPSPGFFTTHAYAAAKAAIIGMSTAAAAHYASQGIRINVLAPGLVETPMAARALGNEAIMRFIATKQPLEGGRVGQPEDLDGAATFFMSDASRFATGQVLAIDGGWCVSEGQISQPEGSK